MSIPFFKAKSGSDEDAKSAPMRQVSMPHVFVVPPEEDERPTWCFFDAENPALSQVMETSQSQDIVVMDFPLDNEGPIFGSSEARPADGVVSRRNPESYSIVDAVMKDQVHGDSDSDSDSEYEQDADMDAEDPLSIHESPRRESRRSYRDAADDSDVIEVVKVGRRRESFQNDQPDAQSIRASVEVKRSNTLKSRASKVFKSLKGSIRSSKPRTQDVVPPVPPLSSSIASSQGPEPSQQDTARSRSSGVKRRGSMILSQLFITPSLRSRSSMSSMDDPSSPTSLTSTFTTAVPSQPNGAPTKRLSRRRTMKMDTIAAQDAARLRATSPTPTTTSTKSSSRFSILNLQKMFSFSTHEPPSVPDATTPVTFDDSDCPTPTRSNSCTPPSVVSSMSTSGPQTPTSTEEVTSVHLVSRKDTADFSAFDSFESAFDMDAGLNLGLGLGLNIDPSQEPESQQATPRKLFGSNSTLSSWRSASTKSSSNSQARRSQAREEADMSLEMRLDSLHFDDISFDAAQFTAH